MGKLRILARVLLVALSITPTMIGCGESEPGGNGSTSDPGGMSVANSASTSSSGTTSSGGAGATTTSSAATAGGGTGGAVSSTSATTASSGAGGGPPSLPCSMPTQSCDGTVIAEGANGAAAFTLVSPYLYWKEAARLMRIRLDPLGAPEVIYDGGIMAVSMAADASYAYFTTATGTLQRIVLGGAAAAPEVLVDLGIPLLDVEVDATSVYVTANNNGFFMLPKGGGEPVSLVSGNASIVELAGDHAYITVRTFTQGTETFDGVVRVPRAGGEVESFYQGGPVVAMEPVANGMLLMKDATVVYQPFGGSATELFTCALECGAIVPDGDVFFVSHNDGPFSEPSSNGVIDSVPLLGGAATRVGEHAGPLFSIKTHLDRIVVSSYQTSGQLLSFGKCPCE